MFLLPLFFMGEVLKRSVGDGVRTLVRFELSACTIPSLRRKSVCPHRAPRGAHFPHKK